MHKRNCPTCSIEITYLNQQTYKKALAKNTKCKKCKDVVNKISSDKIEMILSLNEKNVVNIKIAEITQVSYNAVRSILDRNFRQSYFVSNTIDMVTENEAKCTRCKNILPINSFSIIKKQIRTSICQSCRKNRYYNSLNSSIEKYLSYRFTSLKRTALKRKIPLSITKENFKSQYISQNGKCFYTDADLLCKIGIDKQREVLSVDRVDTSKGYVKGNIVFCTYRINSVKNDLTLEEIKQWMPGWFERIQQFFGEQNAIGSKIST